jgi:hypothetical protein
LFHVIYYFVFMGEWLRDLLGVNPSNLALWHVRLPRLYINLGDGSPKIATLWVDVVGGEVFDMLFRLFLRIPEGGKGAVFSGHNNDKM